MFTLFILAQFVCNFVEDESMYTSAMAEDIQGMTAYDETTSVTDIGNTVSWFDKAWDFVSKLVFFDYTIFKHYDPETGVITANNFVIFRWMLMAIGIVLIIEVFVLGRRLILG